MKSILVSNSFTLVFSNDIYHVSEVAIPVLSSIISEETTPFSRFTIDDM